VETANEVAVKAVVHDAELRAVGLDPAPQSRALLTAITKEPLLRHTYGRLGKDADRAKMLGYLGRAQAGDAAAAKALQAMILSAGPPPPEAGAEAAPTSGAPVNR